MPALAQRGHGALLEGWRPEFERLREQGRAIRQEAIENLHRYLDAFEARAKEMGVTVHRAVDAEAANRYVIELAKRRGLVFAGMGAAALGAGAAAVRAAR